MKNKSKRTEDFTCYSKRSQSQLLVVFWQKLKTRNNNNKLYDDKAGSLQKDLIGG